MKKIKRFQIDAKNAGGIGRALTRAPKEKVPHISTVDEATVNRRYFYGEGPLVQRRRQVKSK